MMPSCRCSAPAAWRCGCWDTKGFMPSPRAYSVETDERARLGHRQGLVLLQHAPVLTFDELHPIAPELGQVLQRAFGLGLIEQDTVAHLMSEHEAPTTRQIRIRHLQIGILHSNVVLAGQATTDVLVALFIVDGGDAHGRVFGVVSDGK